MKGKIFDDCLIKAQSCARKGLKLKIEEILSKGENMQSITGKGKKERKGVKSRRQREKHYRELA